MINVLFVLIPQAIYSFSAYYRMPFPLLILFYYIVLYY